MPFLRLYFTVYPDAKPGSAMTMYDAYHNYCHLHVTKAIRPLLQYFLTQILIGVGYLWQNCTKTSVYMYLDM